jgi:hypothetical protein
LADAYGHVGPEVVLQGLGQNSSSSVTRRSDPATAKGCDLPGR